MNSQFGIAMSDYWVARLANGATIARTARLESRRFSHQAGSSRAIRMCPQFWRTGTLAVSLLVTFAPTGSFAESLIDTDTPNLGQPAPIELIAAWDIDIAPDGSGLPTGSGTSAEGGLLYDESCAACHGPEGIGASAEELAGGDGDLTGDWPDKTIGTYWPYATTLFDFVRRSKPMATPGSFSNDEVYALTAYLLELNGIIDGSEPLDAARLSAVVMPNKGGFVDCFSRPPESRDCAY